MENACHESGFSIAAQRDLFDQRQFWGTVDGRVCTAPSQDKALALKWAGDALTDGQYLAGILDDLGRYYAWTGGGVHTEKYLRDAQQQMPVLRDAIQKVLDSSLLVAPRLKQKAQAYLACGAEREAYVAQALEDLHADAATPESVDTAELGPR